MDNVFAVLAVCGATLEKAVLHASELNMRATVPKDIQCTVELWGTPSSRAGTPRTRMGCEKGDKLNI